MSPKKVKKLADKKYREETGLFIVEGEKNILELLRSDFEIIALFGTQTFLEHVHPLIHAKALQKQGSIEIQGVSERTLEDMGTLQSNTAGILIARQATAHSIYDVLNQASTTFVLALDDIRDPGNLGTIIRTADWYGIKHIIASLTTVDVYNPKVISATMGSFTRVGVTYSPLNEVVTYAQSHDVPLIIADMEGIPLEDAHLPQSGILVMGSESHGISPLLRENATHRLTITRRGGAESLNVSVATGIVLETLSRIHMSRKN